MNDFDFFEVRESSPLINRVNDALYSAPAEFESGIEIDGLSVADLFSLNGAIGSSIEQNVVDTLNDMRSVWDPNNEFTNCSFVRQSQTFPDVLLVNHRNKGEREPIMGIELKSWYLLSKENEPSFRYRVTPGACAESDLLVVYPWALSNAISGEPEIYEPYVMGAKEASEKMDEYWQNERNTNLDTGINRPDGISPYPENSDEIQDEPVADAGHNYGRLSRANVMDEYIERMSKKQVAGVSADKWIEFIRENK